MFLPGGDCFYLKDNELFVKANAPIVDSVIRDRLISLTVKVNKMLRNLMRLIS